MNKPKYMIGDAVYVDFNGEVEGISVKVRKQLWVFGVSIKVDESTLRFGGSYVYSLSEKPPVDGQWPGKQYNKCWESEIIGLVEPVVAEVTKAQAEEEAHQYEQAQKIIEAMKHHETP